MLWKTHQRLLFLNKLIKQKGTGTPKELAKKLGITERAWYKFRDELINDLELPITYCSHTRSYIYTQEGSFEIGFRRLHPHEMEKQNGGRAFSMYSSLNSWQDLNSCYEYKFISNIFFRH